MSTASPVDLLDVPSLWKQYPVYRDSGLDWLGETPADWRVAPVYARYDVQLGKMLDEKRITGDYLAPYLRNVDVQWNRINTDNLPEMDFSPLDRLKFRLAPGDILVCEGGEVGRAAIWNGQLPECYYQKALHRLRRRTTSDTPRFMYYMLLTATKRGVFIANGNPNTIDHLTAEKLRRHRFPFPSAEEQQAIVGFLDRETAAIDALIEKKEWLIALLLEKRAALISRAVTRGLDPTAPMKDAGIPSVGSIPSHWEVKQVARLVPDSRPVMYGIVLPGPNVDDGVPIVKGGDVAPGRLRLNLLNRTTREIESGYARSRLKAGDIVYAIRGSIGMAELVPPEIEGANLTQDAARISPRADVNRNWLLYSLKSKPVFAQLDARATGATIKGINIRDLKRAWIPVPPSGEQKTIASFLETETAKLDRLISRVREHIDKLREYRAALISAAVTGRIDVRGEEP